MFKFILLFVATISLAVGVRSQEPVQWQFSVKKIDEKTYELHLSSKVQHPWHIYSQHTPDGGPVPTKINFAKNPLVELDGPVKEVGKLIQKREEVFEMDVKYFDGNVEFVQVIKLKNKVKTSVKGTVEFMVCNDTQCLPPRAVPFTITLN